MEGVEDNEQQNPAAFRAETFQSRFKIIDLLDKSQSGETSNHTFTSNEHSGVLCDGPLCIEKETFITGTRYKCLVCDSIDFCSNCLQSFFNVHDARHSMLKVSTPQPIHVVRVSPAEADVTRSRSTPGQKQHFITEPAMSMENTQKQAQVKDPIIRTNAPGEGTEHIHQYRIDENGTVSLHHQPIGGARHPKPHEGILHHKDRVIDAAFGKLSPYDYAMPDEILALAWDNHPITRVIDLKPGKFEDRLESTIRVVDLSERPSYEALSYTWKETSFERSHVEGWTSEQDQAFRAMLDVKHAIYFGDEYVPINLGLRDAMLQLRDPHETKTYWIDQICINQGSFAERRFQVSFMTITFNAAKQVVLWTGEQGIHGKTSFDILRKLALAYDACSYYPFSPAELVSDVSIHLPPFDSPDWSAMFQFFRRPVFERFWVIQEVVIAQKVTVRCGDESVSWETLSKATNLLCSVPWLKALETQWAVMKELPLDECRLPHITMIAGFRQDFQSLRELSLERLIYGSVAFKASDPRDRIYALLGFRNARRSKNDVDDVVVNYESPVEEVYTDATMIIMDQSRSFNICGLCDKPKTLKLPSWVPDYSALSLQDGISLSRPDPQNPYHAAGESDFESIRPEPEKGLLAISSFQTDTIATVSDKIFPSNDLEPALLLIAMGEFIWDWTSLAASFGQKYITDESVPDVFWRTCVFDATCGQRECPAPWSYYLALATYLSELTAHYLVSTLGESGDIAQLEERGPPNGILGTFMKEWIEHQNQGEVEQQDPQAIFHFQDCCRNRKFFITEGHYFGIGPKDAQVGDELHIISGSSVPHILRPVKVDKGKGVDRSERGVKSNINIGVAQLQGEGNTHGDPYSHILIGETYVHGLMQGEALKRKDFDWYQVVLG